MPPDDGPSEKISAILLAAGLSRRMGGIDKLLLGYEGETFLSRAVSLMDGLPVFEKILVTTSARLERARVPSGVSVLVNPRPEDGQSGSMRVGLEAATGDHYLFLMADQPLLEAEDLAPILAAAHRGLIVFPVVYGKPCTPALFSSVFRGELLSCSGDSGGRSVREGHPESCRAVEVANPRRFLDVDSTGTYDALRLGRK